LTFRWTSEKLNLNNNLAWFNQAMKIEFKEVVPVPLKNNYRPASDLWGRQLVFEAPNYYLLKAPSGTGKSTFVSFVCGIRTDYVGTIFASDKNFKSFSLKDWSFWRASKLAVVYQDLRLFHHLTAMDNILITPDQHKPTAAEIMEMAKALGIAEKMESKCGTLSLGQQQRVAIIRALAQPFQLLLMDEPFSHLDEDNIRLACALIARKCKENNAGLILTTLDEPYFIQYTQQYNI
jgi:putative ABC transport system ATP-binding protein